MLLSDAIGDRAFEKMRADPVLFVEAFDRQPWDFQADILRQALAINEDGKLKHRVVVVSMPRQNGKSTLSGWSALWRLFCDGPQEIVSVANDKAQARIILTDARRIIRNSEVLYSLIDGRFGLGKTEIRLKDGSSWIIKSADAVFSRGLRPSMIAYDELGWSPDRELFDVLSAGQAAQENPLIFVSSTVGAVQAGILWELFEAARANDPSVLLIYKTENLSPLIQDEYLERQRSLLPAFVFAREHQNLWGSGTDQFCTLDDWNRSIEPGDPRRHDHPGPSYLFCDLGWVKDETAIAVVSKNGDEKLQVLAMEIFKGSQQNPVQFAAVENKIIDLSKRLGVQKVVIESPQGVGLTQDLQSAGLYAETCYPTAKSNQEHWGSLYTALKNGTIILPNDPLLRRQLLTLTIKSGATGWKVVDIPQFHQDRPRAIAGAVYLAQTFDVPWEVY